MFDPGYIESTIIRFENGDLSEGHMLSFFQYLVDSGLIFKIQKWYIPIAESLIETGFINGPLPLRP